jgi:SAM-dependent methyltransferase
MLKPLLQRILSRSIWRFLRSIYYSILRVTGRPLNRAETAKAHARRVREGFFASYCNGRGLDIGYGGDLIAPGARGWDIEHGDAQLLGGLSDASFDYVYSSHTIEHLRDPAEALRNWWRVLKPGGHLIVYLPHRELYEKKKTLPSNWNADHKHFFLPDRDDAPHTIGVQPLIARALPGAEVVYIRECSEGHTITDANVHSDGEYSIEFVLRKPVAN